VKAKGLALESTYPYKGKQNSCNTTAQGMEVAKISNAYLVTANNFDSLLNAVAVRPVSVSVEADQSVWQLYKGGVVTGSCGTNLDHAVNIVGYNTTANPQYWIVRNSWGTWWGESGYIRILISSGSGVCGINMFPMYPTV